MRGRKSIASTTKSKNVSRATAPKKKSRVAKARQGQSKVLQAKLKKANELRSGLVKKLANLNAEMKSKIRQVEHEATEKARSAFEREYTKRGEARRKVVEAALAKFEKAYAKTRVKKSRKKTTRVASSRKKERATKASAEK
jgi:hypothetical protein